MGITATAGRIFLPAMLVLACTRTGWAQPAAPPAAWPEAYYDDAELADVCFADALHGWAVGDRGVIWHTADGGQSWQRQRSGVDCRLESVCFLDSRHGCAVGAHTLPYSQGTRGVVLFTEDGGQRWRHLPAETLPGLTHIRIFPGGRGWALGDPSPLYPSGVFTTRDGGRTWEALPGNSRGWLTGDFLSPRLGVIAGPAGRLAIAGEGRFENTRTLALGNRYLRDLQLTDQLNGWLVGDGGLVLTTADGGISWQQPATEPPRQLTENFDWHAVSVQGEAVWIAGSPGTRILHSSDSGRTWRVQATGQQTPLKAIWFQDAEHGWAVGGMGVVLATGDGGRTWQRQRGGGRVALLAVFSEPSDLPLELIADCAADGYRSAVYILNRRDFEAPRPGETDLARRLHEAIVAAGGASGLLENRFPLRQPGIEQSPPVVLAAWDRVQDGQALVNLDRSLVRAIRTWRPEVIVTHAPTANHEASLDLFLYKHISAAVEQAAEPTAMPELATAAGLAPWQVQRVFGLGTPGGGGDVQITGSRVIPHLGGSVHDLAGRGRCLLSDQASPPRESQGFYRLQDQSEIERPPADFFEGLNLRPGSETRRADSAPVQVEFDELTRLAQRRRNALRIVSLLDQSPQGGQALLAQLGDLTGELPEEAAGEVLYQLSGELHETGHLDLSAEVLTVLVEQYPHHQLWQAATTELVRHYASQEIGWRLTRERTAATASPQQRATRALALGKAAIQRDPTLIAEPSLQFPLSAAARQTGLHAEGNRYYHSLVASDSESWKAAAAGELWLNNDEGVPPRPVWRCSRATTPPQLDGQLNEAVWQTEASVSLTSGLGDDSQWPAAARLAYDDEYLYLAVECRQAPGVNYTDQQPQAPRPRDADLENRDRVTLLLDTDRDYATWWSLTCDHRGWPAESLDSDATWDPQWYIAAHSDEEIWTLEAAIPLEELSPQTPRSGTVWNVGVQRVVPQVGFQAWSRPAAVDPQPQGFGFLLFQ